MDKTNSKPSAWLAFLDETFPDKTTQSKVQALFGSDASFTRFLKTCNIGPDCRSTLRELYSSYQSQYPPPYNALMKKEFKRHMKTLFRVETVGTSIMVYGLELSQFQP